MTTIKLIQAFEAQYFEKINLVASENISSADVRYALQSDFHHRYAMPPEGQADPALWPYPNQEAIREIIAETQERACALFHAGQADVSPLSGNQIADIMLSSLLEKGDGFLSVSATCGGHFTTDKIAQENGYNRFNLPYDTERGVLDVEKTASLVKETGAKLIFLDASMILFPYPVRELRDAIGEDIIISYDASHTLGMIAGKVFQSPLEEGADFLHGSTHKSLWGPQKGMIMSAKGQGKSETVDKLFSRIVPRFVSNAHPHHIAALGVALDESSRYGEQFAHNTVRNARILGKALTNKGVHVCFPEKDYTECHQLVVRIGTNSEAKEVFKALEGANIHVNPIRIPYTDGHEFGLRIGLSEITRRGIVGLDTVRLGGFIADIVHKSRSVENVRNDVIALSRTYKEVHYTDAVLPKAGKADIEELTNDGITPDIESS